MLTCSFKAGALWLKGARWFWPVAAIVAFGLIRALLTYNIWFNFEDQATFFIFGHDILRGEIIYKDFIHFRTPGFYFLSAAFQAIFGAKLATEQLLLALESFVIYPLLLYLAAWLITRRRWVAFSLGLMAALLPQLLQIRAGLALLAVATYIVAQTATSTRRKHRRLFLSGLLLGGAFIFGQETAILAAGVVGLCELRFTLSEPRQLVRRARSLVTGAVLALLPLIAYVGLFSSIRNFLYYVFEYAFVIQPASMNFPYPPPLPPNHIFYLPFLVLAASFAAFYLADDLNPVNLPILMLATVRMVTPLGRADEGHLIFALPEILLLIPFAAVSVGKMRITRGRLLRLAGWLTAIVVVFWVAIHGHSVVIAAAAVLYVLASLMSKSGRPRVLGLAFRQEAAVLTATAWVMVTLLFLPQIYTYGRLVKAGWKRLHMPAPHTVSGTPIDSVEFQEVDAISRLVEQYHATVLFSYPIQPFYYSLVPRHATRFITFEPQTTAEEQAEAIEDLKRSKPQLVIMDVRQANGMQKSVGRISDYITENFEPVAEIDNRRPLMVLVPRPASSSTER
jgi:hypothetical protein